MEMNFNDMRKYLDAEYGSRITKELSQIGNDDSPMGFRNAGSTGEKRAAGFLKDEMERIGLGGVALESFPVDGWEFSGAELVINPGTSEKITIPLSAFAGTSGTKGQGIYAEIVDIGGGTYEACASSDLTGKIAFAQIDIDDYWVGIPAYQAELRGAIALIVSYRGNSFGEDPEAINSADGIARTTIPILNISKSKGSLLKELIGVGTCFGKLVVNAKLYQKSSQSQNVVGMISGENTEKYIILAAHYDAFFHACQDNAFGVGVIMTLAKAIIDSGKKPKNTVIIIAHGAEEFGACNSHYDWCIGAWQQITELHPEWAEKIKVFINIDAVNPDAKEFTVSCTRALQPFMEACFSEQPVSEKVWASGTQIGGINGPWSDDYHYAAAGAPVVICGRGESSWRSSFYHTQFDCYEFFNKELFEATANAYLSILTAVDNAPFLPLDMTRELISLESSINKIQIPNLKAYVIELLSKISELKIQAQQYLEDFRETAWPFNVNRLIFNEFYGLDFSDTMVYRHEYLLNNLELLKAAIAALEKNQGKEALEFICKIDGAKIADVFERQVYQYWYLDAVNKEKRNLNWGIDKIPSTLDVYNVLHSIKNKIHVNNPNYNWEIQLLNSMYNKEKDMLEQMLKLQNGNCQGLK